MKTILTINTEYFHQEMGKLIFNFTQIVENVQYNSKKLFVYHMLLRKIISNVTSANILIYENYINEAQIILRSALETVILITYLSQFPNEIDDYLDDAQILKLKCNFIAYKKLKMEKDKDINEETYTQEELAIESQRCFDIIRKTAKEKIMKKSRIKKFIFNEENFEKIDKYFSEFKSDFMRYEKMYKKLDVVNFKIKGINDYSLKDIVYTFYNDSSQIAHGCFLDWNHEIKFTIRDAEHLFHFFMKTTLFLKVLLKDTINFNIDKTKPFERAMKQANDNLEKLIYGKKLRH